MYVGIAHSNQARHVKKQNKKKRSTSRLRVLLISFVQEESGGRPLSSENDVILPFPFMLLDICEFEDISGTLSFLLCWRCGNH